MRKLLQIKQLWATILFIVVLSATSVVRAETLETDGEIFIDRIQLVAQQIDLLKSRYKQTTLELADLQKQHDNELSELAVEKASKNLLDKASLDISVSRSNLDSVNIELTDSQQTINWLEKSTQEIENQLNVLNIFGLKVARNEIANIKELRSDLTYQGKLLDLEKNRVKLLEEMQGVASNILQLKKEKYNRINAILKSRRLLHVKQQQVQDELAFQQQQNYWLQELNSAYARLAKVDPIKSKPEYAEIEREIFYANENANYAYIQSLIARYKDQIQQMKIGIIKGSSISLLNEIGDQVVTLTKQVSRLDAVLKTRISVLENHQNYLSKKKKNADQIKVYVDKLAALEIQYKASDNALVQLNKNLATVRTSLDQSLQTELSSRQGLPSFGLKTFIDIGKEMLLVPALTFQVVKSLMTHSMRAFAATTSATWCVFALAEIALLLAFGFFYKFLVHIVNKSTEWHEKLTSKWLFLLYLKRNFIDIALVGNFLGVMWLFSVPYQTYQFVVYLSMVWLAFKGINTVARVTLIEATENREGDDVKLYHRLKWVTFVGGFVTFVTVFIHQLPLIYEVKTLCDRLFLLCLIIASVLLLRSWRVISALIFAHMENRHPYIEKCIRLIGLMIPILTFGNSVIGMFGFINLVMTVSWYEGVFLIVLIGYLILRGLLSDLTDYLSQFMVQHVHNGWLWTEAFLKPIDKLLRITLFLMGGATLFLLYGWDERSPIVTRLNRLLHHKLIEVLNTTITPINVIKLFVVISVFYWTAKWIREFVYRMLQSRTNDMGIRNSIAILSQYGVVCVGAFFCLRVLGIDMQALAYVISAFAFGIGLGMRDLVNNFACGFLILLERPLRVGDIVSINGIEGEVSHIGSRAVTLRTWDRMEHVVPNAEIYNKSFTNWTAKDNIVRSIAHIKISRYDNPHEVKVIIQNILHHNKEVLKDPAPEVLLKEMSDALMDFEMRYFVNIRQVKSRIGVMSAVLMTIWDEFAKHGIKPPSSSQEIVIRNEMPDMPMPVSLSEFKQV